MNSWKRLLLFIFHFLTIVLIIKYNAETIVNWLNKSLFIDFDMEINPDNTHESFYNGTSIIFFMSLFLYALIGTFLVSLIITNIIWGGLIIANQMKVQERNEFITFKELYTITSPKELMNLVELPIGISLLVFFSATLMLVMLHFVTKKFARKLNFHLNLKTRIIILFLALIPLMFIFLKPNVYNEYVLRYEDEHVHNWNPVTRAKTKGFLPSFIHTISPDYMQKPLNYNKKQMQMIEEKYEITAKKINTTRVESINNSQTIYYLSETLMDPMTIPSLLENESPIPYITKMRHDYIGGTLYSQYIGGGTANIEWSLLTSFSLEVFNDPISITPYSDFYVQSKNHHTILSLFDNEKVALHPYSAHLYKRRSVYNAIGFDDFLYLDNGIQHTDKIGSYTRISDAALHRDLLRIADNRNVGFIHVLSMQNHSPFNGEIPDMDYMPNINTDYFPSEKVKELQNYLRGLRASDDAVRELIEKFDSADRDINLIFFGDHFPSIFRGLENLYPGDQLHLTPWFIYMNHGRGNNEVEIDGISPMFLTTVLLREGNYYVTPFQALMDELLSSGVKRIAKDFVVTEKGKVSDEMLDKETLEFVQDYRQIVYDALFGANWLSDSFFKDYYYNEIK